jgi:hypothetical protein
MLAATAASWYLGEHGASGPASGVPALLVLGLALLKGLGIALAFMELHQAPRLARWLVTGWLGAVVALLMVVRVWAGG